VGERNRLVQHLTLKAQNIACDAPTFFGIPRAFLFLLFFIFLSFSFSNHDFFRECVSCYLTLIFLAHYLYFLFFFITCFRFILATNKIRFTVRLYAQSLFNHYSTFDLQSSVHSQELGLELKCAVSCGNRIIPVNFPYELQLHASYWQFISSPNASRESGCLLLDFRCRFRKSIVDVCTRAYVYIYIYIYIYIYVHPKRTINCRASLRQF